MLDLRDPQSPFGDCELVHSDAMAAPLCVAATFRQVQGRAKSELADIGVVLPVRIELTTSPLPRGCSTTELRQRRAAGDV
jgi:hypothetical protein